MDGGNYSTVAFRAWIIIFALLGLAAAVSAYFGATIDMLDSSVRNWSQAGAPEFIDVQSKPLETAAFFIGASCYLLIIFVGFKEYSSVIPFFATLLIVRMILVGISRGFSVPFGDVFHGPNFERPGPAYFWIGDYITSNFEWAIILIILFLSLPLRRPSLPSLSKVLENIGKENLLPQVTFNIDAELEPVKDQKQTTLIATNEEILIVPNSTASGISKDYVRFSISSISKLETTRIRNTRWNLAEANPEEYIQVKFILKNEESYTRYIFLGITENEVNSSLPEISRHLSSLSKTLVIKKLADKKTNSGKMLIGGGGAMIIETFD